MAGRPGVSAGRGLGLLSALVYAFLYAPILVLAALSFNASRLSGAWEGFTLDWYLRAAANPAILASLRNSLLVGAVVTALATALATAAAPRVPPPPLPAPGGARGAAHAPDRRPRDRGRGVAAAAVRRARPAPGLRHGDPVPRRLHRVLRVRRGEGAHRRLRQEPRGGGDGPGSGPAAHVPDGHAAGALARRGGGGAARVRAVDRRLRRDLVRRRRGRDHAAAADLLDGEERGVARDQRGVDAAAGRDRPAAARRVPARAGPRVAGGCAACWGSGSPCSARPSCSPAAGRPRGAC